MSVQEGVELGYVQLGYVGPSLLATLPGALTLHAMMWMRMMVVVACGLMLVGCGSRESSPLTNARAERALEIAKAYDNAGTVYEQQTRLSELCFAYGFARESIPPSEIPDLAVDLAVEHLLKAVLVQDITGTSVVSARRIGNFWFVEGLGATGVAIERGRQTADGLPRQRPFTLGADVVMRVGIDGTRVVVVGARNLSFGAPIPLEVP